MSEKRPKLQRRRYIKSAEEIRLACKGSGIVEEIAYDILLVIESDIEKAIEGKFDKSITEISTNFNIPPMKRSAAQRAVYYKIMKELKTSGYIPNIEIRGSKEGYQQVFIHVKWRTVIDETEEQMMDNYIRQHALVTESTKKAPGSNRRRPNAL
jgi:hypothetical protein